MNLKEKYQDSLEAFRAITLRDVLERVVVFGVFLASLWLLWWSWQRIVPLDKQATIMNRRVANLSSEIDQFEQIWNPARIEALTARYQAATEKLFATPEVCNEWTKGLSQLADYLALGLEAKTGTPQQFKVGQAKLSAVPVTLTVRALPGPPGVMTPYKRLIRLVERVVSAEKRAELVGLEVRGASNSIAQAVLVVNLWSLQKEAP